MATRLKQPERRERTRHALLAAARKVFGKRGFGASTLDEIAETAGVTRGALYYNFPGGKEDLFAVLLEERVEERASAIRARFADDGDVVGQARAAADDAFAAVQPNREWQLLSFEFALHAARDRRFAKRYMACEEVIRSAIEDVIVARMRAAGIDLAVRPRDLAIGMNALGVGLSLDALVAEDSVPDELFGTLVELLVRGVLAATNDPDRTHKGGRR